MRMIPNLLSGFRILAVPFLLFFAWKGDRDFFIGLLAASFLSDSIDGYIARKLNVSSNLGAKLDTYGDMGIYLTMPLCAWWLWPQLLKQEVAFVFIALVAYIVPILAGLVKFKKVPSYHTWGAKIAAVLMSIAVFTLFLFEFAWVFRTAAIFQAIVACELVMITIRLPMPQSNVKSLWHVHRDLSQNK